MLRHVVGFNYKKEFSQEQNENHAIKIKADIEGLKDLIPQIQHIELIIQPLKTTTFDMVLVAEFKDEEDLKAYDVHEAHKKAANFIISVMTDIQCIDYMY